MAWLEANNADRNYLAFGLAEWQTGPQRFTTTAHRMLADYQDKPWENFERAMENLRFAVKLYEGTWKDTVAVTKRNLIGSGSDCRVIGRRHTPI